MTYYCYNCSNQVSTHTENSQILCNLCNSDFVEEINASDPPIQADPIIASPFEALLQSLIAGPNSIQSPPINPFNFGSMNNPPAPNPENTTNSNNNASNPPPRRNGGRTTIRISRISTGGPGGAVEIIQNVSTIPGSGIPPNPDPNSNNNSSNPPNPPRPRSRFTFSVNDATNPQQEQNIDLGTGITDLLQFLSGAPLGAGAASPLSSLLGLGAAPGGLQMGDYFLGENLDALMEALAARQRVGPPPAPKEAIEHLEEYAITQHDVDNKRDCVICQEFFKLDEKVLRLPCSHYFHGECVKPWLERHNSCPVCRKALPTKEGAEESKKEGDEEMDSSSSSENAGIHQFSANPEVQNPPPNNDANNNNTSHRSGFMSMFSSLFGRNRSNNNNNSSSSGNNVNNNNNSSNNGNNNGNGSGSSSSSRPSYFN